MLFRNIGLVGWLNDLISLISIMKFTDHPFLVDSQLFEEHFELT